MDDIILCTSDRCKYKAECARQYDINPDNIFQSYVNLNTVCNDNNDHEYYIPLDIAK